jgi:hypothetical protein
MAPTSIKRQDAENANVASVISHFAPKTVESYSTPMQNDTGHNGIFHILPLLLKLAPFFAH